MNVIYKNQNEKNVSKLVENEINTNNVSIGNSSPIRSIAGAKWKCPKSAPSSNNGIPPKLELVQRHKY